MCLALVAADFGPVVGLGGTGVALGFLFLGSFGVSLASIAWNIFSFSSKISLLRLGWFILGGLGSRICGSSCCEGGGGFFFNFVDFLRPLWRIKILLFSTFINIWRP